MFFKLVALFTIVPLIELALLIPLGIQIGLWPTIGLVVATALLGAFLAKLEGSRALAKIKQELNSGKLPADSLLDGLAILIAGVFLITPGVLTDVVAIGLLIPPLRVPLRAMAKTRIKKMMETDSMTFISSNSFEESIFETTVNQETKTQVHRGSPFGPSSGDEDVIDVTPADDDGSSPETDDGNAPPGDLTH